MRVTAESAPTFLQHSHAARAELPEAMLAVAALLNIRVILDFRAEVAGPFTIAFVRHPRGIVPDGPSVIAYVHCEIKPEWVADEAAWLELFSQLWPGY